MTSAPVNRVIDASVVDGPGNRTVFFLQGCNYRCLYCHNPETQNLCCGCGRCVAECPQGAIRISDGRTIWDAERCVTCDHCIRICPHHSSPRAVWKTAADCALLAEANRPFIRGITVSGGECTLYPEFLMELFERTQMIGLSNLIDSNGSYLVFYGIGWAGVRLLDSRVAFSVSSMLSSIGIVGRKILLPLSFAAALAGEATGSLMAALQAMRFPKAVGIAVAVVLRFFPTISGEYRAIRSSQRFRGIGVGVVHTLTHLPATVEYILIPLILRTTRVAEELSASMTVRGVRFSGATISYRPIRFGWKDGALCVFMALIAGVVFVLEKGGIL